MTGQEVVLAGVPGAVLVMALVQLVRGYGLPTRYAPLASVVAGVAVALLVEVSVVVPGSRDWIGALVAGLVLGLSATGAHSVVTKTTRRS